VPNRSAIVTCLVSLITVVTFTGGCSHRAAVEPPEPMLTADAGSTAASSARKPLTLEEVVDSIAAPLISSGRNIGMVVAVTTPEGDLIKSYGRKSRDSDEPLSSDAVFQVGSITKSFAAVLLADFERAGRLKFSDTVRSVAPTGSIHPQNDIGEVRLGELPSHTSGMPQEGYTPELLWGVTTYLLTGDNLYRYYNTQRLTDWLSKEPISISKKGSYSYSNIAMTLLGWLLGTVDNKGWRHHLHERILKPLQMTATDITLSHEQIDHLTPGYAGDLPTFVPRHRRVNPWLFDEGISASGGIHSTAGDLLRYCKAAMGRTPSPLRDAFSRTQQVVTTQPDGEMAYAWFVEKLPETGEPFYHIAGIIGGHTSWVGYDLKRGIGVVLLQNSINHDDQLSIPLLDRLVAIQKKKEERIARHTDSQPAGR
jgi:CubicO group peptidase (beta-lactamase class C family)